MEMLPYHPYRSAEAKGQYLRLYDMRAKKWPVPSETRMVDTSYGQTFVRISGPVDAPLMVLLHGGSGNSLQWIPNIKALSEFFKTYAVDNIYDYGRSVYTRLIKRPDDFINWLDELFAALEQRDNINLVGLSYGGWLTSLYALRFPDRLNKIVLLAPAFTVLPVRLGWIIHAIAGSLPHRFFARNFMRWLAEDLVHKDEAGRVIAEEMADDAYMAMRCFKPKRMVYPTVLTDNELQGIKVPTLYLIG
ncbi:MAG TPA: alpha/beta hydrolase, partial [Syntrophales bacterium]|nr:alpha/beta hydrolase [Syntrophales bacterium]